MYKIFEKNIYNVVILQKKKNECLSAYIVDF